uniref:Uncharacterized protein n=1 Tax=Lepeophtheirus salmonis TaxID=72036 RepID=A0A0K2UI34_LEPSM
MLDDLRFYIINMSFDNHPINRKMLVHYMCNGCFSLTN